MNSARKHAVVALLALFAAGCAEKKVATVPPAQAQAPAVTTGKAGAMYPPPLTEAQAEPKQPEPPPAPAPPLTAPQTEPEPPPANTGKPPSKHKSKPSPGKPASGNEPGTANPSSPASAAPASSDAPTEVAAAAPEPPAASPIGQLSTAGAPGQTHSRKETADLITSTETGLNNIKRSLNTQEQETANQIKTFLAKAKQALDNQDPDGALTLATKAKVLLDELNKT